MLLIDELIEKVKSYNENADIDMIRRAYKMADEHHRVKIILFILLMLA